MDILYTKHALQRMFEREITIDEIEDAIINGIIVSNYPNDKPYPSKLVYNKKEELPLHVVYAIDGSRYVIITVYRPELDEWNDGFLTKRSEK